MASTASGSRSSAHPGTSGRSPPPPRGAGGSVPALATGGGGAGRPSIGSTSAAAAGAAGGGGRPSSSSLDANSGRFSYGSAVMRGTRLSYGVGAASALHGGGATPAHHQSSVMSPPSTSSTGNKVHSQSDFFAALSPSTSKYLSGGATGAGGGATAGRQQETASSASRAAANAVRTAANAARGIDDGNDQLIHMDDDPTSNPGDCNEKQHIPNKNIVQDFETIQLRRFVQSLLGMQLPASAASSTPTVPSMTTPDPTTAAFFATSLLTKTSNNDGRWRPDDAYLAARALSLKGEHKRAIWILDKVGLIGFGMGSGGGNEGSGGAREGDVGGGVTPLEHVELGSGNREGLGEDTMDVVRIDPSRPAISNERGIRNALLLRAESALLAGQCLVHAGEYERALTVYEEAMRFPPPPPPLEWGAFGYGYRLDGVNLGLASDGSRNGVNEVEETEGFDARLADEMYIRSWREQSLSHMALIDDGDDERLLQLAANVRPLPFSMPPSSQSMVMEGIHPMARLCSARGISYDAISNPHRAVPFLRMALAIDARCMEALDYVVSRRLLTPDEEREWMSTLNFGGEVGALEEMGISWLRDAYLARLRGGGSVGGLGLPPSATDNYLEKETGDDRNDKILGASPVPRSDLQSPSMLSLGSPDFAGGAREGGGARNQMPIVDSFVKKAVATPSMSQTVDEAFHNLAINHSLGHSPDVLSNAAIRSYSLHDLHSALAYCTAIDAIDPYCRTAGYVHVATLVGLNLKRRLFQLAHRLVDTDPKDALAWFSVGSYYYACKRYDLAQRHFSRSTRLDPSSAECWIGFGCSFAVCDESDQALASFRAAQNKFSGSHVPLLYMGMEYLRTNHLSLAGHFLNSAQRTDPDDMLCCNELGVWAYRQGDMEDAAFWFIKALRLNVKQADVSSLTSADEGLGMDGYVLLTGTQGGEEDKIGDKAPLQGTVATPHTKPQFSIEEPPFSTVLCAVKTPSGQSIAASMPSEKVNVDSSTGGLTDMECIERIKDHFWEPTVFNLGQSYRKIKRYEEAIACFEKCSSLNPGNYAAYAALGFAKHLGGDIDSAIDSYHEALSRKPEDPFASEMLTRALHEVVTYPPSLAMLSPISPGGDLLQSSGVGSSILKKIGVSSGGTSVQSANTDQDPASMFMSNSNDVDMSLA
mmetsp:Transcript_24708/g.59568  ORF Transcript_24708/g.59568 Transcript_24708/m.59568 type:complete len:1161 (-) Transcript_24708:151-3633(-)